MAYWDESGIGSWIPGQPIPGSLLAAIKTGEEIEAHNVAFEEAIWYNVMVPKYGWPPIDTDLWRDSMATACYLALPASLDRLSKALGGSGKDVQGQRLINTYSTLYKPSAKAEIPHEDLQRFVEYCMDDVAQEAGISEFLGQLPEKELESFLIDRQMNRRGIYLDVEGIRNALHVVRGRVELLKNEFIQISGVSPTQRDKFLVWLKERGVRLPDLRAETVRTVLGDPDYCEEVEVLPGIFGPVQVEIPEQVRRALEIRNEISKTSTTKLDAMLRHVSEDGRARNQTRYHGATTGRNTGMGFQPLNLTRSEEGVDPEDVARQISYRDAEWLDLLYGDAMSAISKASRFWIMAEPGNEIIATDYVSIEAVVLACLAGEEWKIEAFRNREPIYERMGEKIHGLPRGTVTKKTHPFERQDGKTGELAFGYQGALGAWRQFDRSDTHSDERVIEICKIWREEHLQVVNMWKGYENCIHHALNFPGSVPEYRGIKFRKHDHWISIELLNGKRIWYFQPEFRLQMPPWHDPEKHEECAAGTCDHEPRPVVTYMTYKGGQWKRVSTYGGKITENITQATAREILEVGKRRVCRELGYNPFILSVYDEAVAEVVKDSLSIEQYEAWLLEPEDWYADWPISCDTWRGRRYRK